MSGEWFRQWFGASYKKLYVLRDSAQAEAQVNALLSHISPTDRFSVLDVGCGAGRHLTAMRKRGIHPLLGIDLSLELLKDSRHAGHPLLRADMRRLPLKNESFELITCFFTSFGYFATLQEDEDVLESFSLLLQNQGHLFLDLMDRTQVLKNLVTESRHTVDGNLVIQHRRQEGDCVVKDIEIRHSQGQVERHQERVRLFALEEIREMASCHRLQLQTALGNEIGDPYIPGVTPRMSLLFQKT